MVIAELAAAAPVVGIRSMTMLVVARPRKPVLKMDRRRGARKDGPEEGDEVKDVIERLGYLPPLSLLRLLRIALCLFKRTL